MESAKDFIRYNFAIYTLFLAVAVPKGQFMVTETYWQWTTSHLKCPIICQLFREPFVFQSK